MAQPLCKTVWRFLKSLNTESPCDPAIPIPGYLSKGAENICPHAFKNSSIIHGSQKAQSARACTHGWVNRRWRVRTKQYDSTGQE